MMDFLFSWIIGRIGGALTRIWIFLTDVGDFTFTRTGDQTFTDFEGLIKTVPTDQSAHVGARMVSNALLDSPDDIDTSGSWNGFDTGTATPQPSGISLVDLSGSSDARVSSPSVVGGVPLDATFRYTFLAASVSGDGSGTYPMSVLNGSDGQDAFQVSLTEVVQRFSFLSTAQSVPGTQIVYVGNRRDGPASTLNRALIGEVLVENVTGQANQNPSEFVDGIEFFLKENGNTVDGNGVVTEATGAAITGATGVLGEGARTNIVKGSRVLDTTTADWVEFDSGTATPTVAVNDPSGGLNAGLVDLSANANARVAQDAATLGSSDSTVYRYTLYFRALAGQSGTFPFAVSLGGTFTGYVATIDDTGWTRVDVDFTTGVGSNLIYIGNRRDGPAHTLTSAYVWNPQVELGSFPSSPIVTEPTASATRAATSMTRAWPFPANGITAQIKPTVNFDEADDKGSDVILLEFSDGTADNYLRVTFDQTNDQIHLKKRVSAGTEVVASTIATNLNYTDGDQLNIRLRANDTDGISLEVDGETRVDVGTGDAKTDWSTKMTQIEIHPAFVAVESHRIWNGSLSNAEMGALT